VAAARGIQVSAHCAPNLTIPIAAATPNFRHIEWFADHDRIESEFFDGAADPLDGRVRPAAAGSGHGDGAAPCRRAALPNSVNPGIRHGQLSRKPGYQVPERLAELPT
jgi:hypothetical protein